MRKYYFFLSLLFCVPFFSATSIAQTIECCDDPACKAEGERLVKQADKALDFLGPYPADVKTDYEGKRDFIQSIKIKQPGHYNKLRKAIRDINKWSVKNSSRRVCLSRLYANLLTEHKLNWLDYFVSAFYSSSFKSPEFSKGFGTHLHVAMGSQSLFTNEERFVSTGGALVSYTFTPKGETAGGRFRIMLGPSFFYSTTKTYLMVNPRAEIRLFDIGNDFTNIGCFKLITQGAFQKEIQMAGLGLAAEISRFNIEFKGDYEFKSNSFIVQTGLMYSIFYNRYKK